MLYDESRFDDWKNGIHGYSKSGTGCCLENRKTKSYSGGFDINKGVGVKYQIVIEGAEKASIKFKLTQVLKF